MAAPAARRRLVHPRGRPELYPATAVIADGWKREIDSTDWLITEINHDLSDRALTSSVEMEVWGTQ